MTDDDEVRTEGLVVLLILQLVCRDVLDFMEGTED
jgi:hypothetical protein